MAIKTFTTGEVLTASDTNTYLANAGLVYITSTTVGSAVSSVTVSNCFSSTYKTYLIHLAGIKSTTQVGVTFQLSGITTGYDFQGFYMLRGSSAITGFNTTGASTWDACATDSGASFHELIVQNPNTASPKVFMARGSGEGGTDIGVQTWGQNSSTSTATGFVIAPAASTLTGGTIVVYGYRIA